jgi:hypothetical protein
MSKTSEPLPERHLINRKRVELITYLKGGSLSRAIQRGQLPEPLMFENTPRWWEHEIYEALEKVERGRGRFSGKRHTGRRAKPEDETTIEVETPKDQAIEAQAIGPGPPLNEPPAKRPRGRPRGRKTSEPRPPAAE